MMKAVFAGLLYMVTLAGCEVVLLPVVLPANALIDKAGVAQPVLLLDSAGRPLAGPQAPKTPPEAEFAITKSMDGCSGFVDKVPGYGGAPEQAGFRCTSGQRGKMVVRGGADSWGGVVQVNSADFRHARTRMPRLLQQGRSESRSVSDQMLLSRADDT